MAATDALFWYAESAMPIFRPIIAALHVLEEAPDPERMKKGLEIAVKAIPRLRQRVLELPFQLFGVLWGLGIPGLKVGLGS